MSFWRNIGRTLVKVPDQDPKTTARTRLALPTVIGTGAF